MSVKESKKIEPWATYKITLRAESFAGRKFRSFLHFLEFKMIKYI